MDRTDELKAIFLNSGLCKVLTQKSVEPRINETRTRLIFETNTRCMRYIEIEDRENTSLFRIGYRATGVRFVQRNGIWNLQNDDDQGTRRRVSFNGSIDNDDFLKIAKKLKELLSPDAKTPAHSPETEPQKTKSTDVVMAQETKTGDEDDSQDKIQNLRSLAKKRQEFDLKNNFGAACSYHHLNEYDVRYECNDFVSPYTKGSGNVNSDIVLMLQDWTTDESLRGPFNEERARIGRRSDKPANIILTKLTTEIFDRPIEDFYGTNLFPFIKEKKLPMKDFILMAKEFALKEVNIIKPKFLVCLGSTVFKAIWKASGKPESKIYSSTGKGKKCFYIRCISNEIVMVFEQFHPAQYTQTSASTIQDWTEMKRMMLEAFPPD